MKFKVFSLFIALILVNHSFASNIYVATDGNDSNTGTISSPFRTLQTAIGLVQNGDTIYMRGGTYVEATTILIDYGNNGVAEARKHVFAFKNEEAILDFSSMIEDPANRGVKLLGDYWYFKNVIIESAGDNGMLIAGNYNIVENCIFRKNRDTGLQISRRLSALTEMKDWPSYNQILYCESYDNSDSDHEDADGFAPKLTCGEGNIFVGCISHHNIDDGYDLYTKTESGPIGAVTFIECVAHSNGILTDGSTSGNGDKNGFKMGGEQIGVNHIFRKCVAFNNGKHGFTFNNNLGQVEVTNCTSYNNDERNFNFDGGDFQMANNLSYKTTSNDKSTGTDLGGNIWDQDSPVPPINVLDSDFESLTPGDNAHPFNYGFLKLSGTSQLIDKGVVIANINYNGNSPDVGAFELGGTSSARIFSLSISVDGSEGGYINVNPDQVYYDSATVVTLSAVRLEDWNFVGWSNDQTGTDSIIQVVMNENKNIKATFKTDKLMLSYQSTGPGKITSSSDKGLYDKGDEITLTATPNDNSVFIGWSGDTSGTTNPLVFSMEEDVNVIAMFQRPPVKEIVIQFEESYCELNGSVETEHSGYLGSGFIDFDNSTGSNVVISVDAAEAIASTITIRYAHGKTDDRSIGIFVNDISKVAVADFVSTGAFTSWDSVSYSVDLNQGNNKINFVALTGNGGPNFDQLRITSVTPSISVGICDSNDVTINAPTILVAEVKSDTEIGLSWIDNADNETGFYLERKTATSDFETIATLSANSINYGDYNLVSGTTYTYRVKAFNVFSESENSNAATILFEIKDDTISNGNSFPDINVAIKLKVFPNPVQTNTVIQFSSEIGGVAQMNLIDLLGVKTQLFDGVINKNQINSIRLDSESFKAGIYFLELIIDNNQTTQKIIIQ